MKIKVYHVLIIVVIITTLFIGFLLQRKNINVKPVSIGSDNDYIYLIYSDLSSKKIYKFSHYYRPYYILRDNIIYVIYEKTLEEDKTAYVDIINLLTGEKEKITIEEIKAGNKDKDYNVYYEVIRDHKLLMVYKNLKDNIEFVDNYTNNYEAFQEEGTYKLIISLNDAEKYSAVKIGEGFDFQINMVYYINSDKNIKKEIYMCDKDGYIVDISFIRKDLLRISVAHINASSWETDQVIYYNTNTGKITERNDKYYYDIFLLDEDVDIKIAELKEEKIETKSLFFDPNIIEQDFSTSQKRILNEDIKDIDEEIICKKTDLSMEDLIEYKNSFIGKKTSADSYTKENDEEKYLKIAERNYNILKYFISISNDKFIASFSEFLNKEHEDKYNKLSAAILSGIIKYYFDEDIDLIDITAYKHEPLRGYDVELVLENNYAMAFEFQVYSYDFISVTIYNDAKSCDDVYNNYEKYEGNNNIFLKLYIKSYEYMR